MTSKLNNPTKVETRRISLTNPDIRYFRSQFSFRWAKVDGCGCWMLIDSTVYQPFFEYLMPKSVFIYFYFYFFVNIYIVWFSLVYLFNGISTPELFNAEIWLISECFIIIITRAGLSRFGVQFVTYILQSVSELEEPTIDHTRVWARLGAEAFSRNWANWLKACSDTNFIFNVLYIIFNSIFFFFLSITIFLHRFMILFTNPSARADF